MVMVRILTRLRQALPGVVGLLLALGVSGAANAATLVLDSFVDQTTEPINLPVTNLLMATVNTTATQGGSDATATTVTIGGSVLPADVAEVCIDYNATQVACVTNPNPLNNISISLPGNQKGGSPFDYRLTLNPSAGAKNIQLTVVSITNIDLTDNLPLPQSTAIRTIFGGVTLPALSTPVLVGGLPTVTSTGADLGATQTSTGGATVTARGIVWNTTGSPTTADTTVPLQSGDLANEAYNGSVSPLTEGTLIYFRGYATNSVGDGYTPTDGTLYTEPAAQATGIGFSAITADSMTVSWTVPGGRTVAEGVIVVMKAGSDPAEVPADGSDASIYSPSSAWLSAGAIGTAKVVYLASGSSVNVTELASNTFYYVRIYEYAGTGTGEPGINYLEELPLAGNGQTGAPAVAPTVINPSYADVITTTATLGGRVDADGGSNITDYGVNWGIDLGGPYPNNVPSGSGGPGPFDFTVPVTGLPPGTAIYFVAWAINSAGTSYSTESSFSTPVTLPTVDTPSVTGINTTSAFLGGTVSNEGGGSVSARGVVWNTTSPPETGGTIEAMGSGPGLFSLEVFGLPTSVLVYYRAYATNETGTAYSAIDSFTPSGPPTVTTPTVTSITHNSAVLGATVTSNGGNPILERGTVWNLSGTPVIETHNVNIEGSTTTGTFSQTVSLPTGQTIFYRGYASNATGTGYSTEDSFATPTEPTGQASNISFERVAGSSMSFSWTRGNGNGSIVVMRLLATGKTDPQDGDDYTANPDYTIAPELPVNSQNFVVYKGSNNYVHVTGLIQSTAYSIAIYEYAGAGVSIDYLQLTPAEANQTTTDFAVHNMDNGLICSNCHNAHVSFLPRNTEMKTVCETCHWSGGQASAKLEFDLHLTPGRNPGIDYVDCGYCHELHNHVGPNTTQAFNSITTLTDYNKSFLRANVNKYVSTAASAAFLHNDTPKREGPHPDAPLAADTPERGVEGGDDITARGYCQVCHSMTNNHRSSNTAGSDQCHNGEGPPGNCGPAETHCGSCHEHNNRFQGVGGSQTCIECHSSTQGARPIITTQFDRVSSHITSGSGAATQADCVVCHDDSTMGAGYVMLWNADDGVTSHSQPTQNAPPTDAGEGEAFVPVCLSCHADRNAGSLPASGSDQTQTSPFIGSDLTPTNLEIDATAWASASHNRDYATYPTSSVSCIGDGTNGCHGSGHGSNSTKLRAPADGPAQSLVDFCFVCHDSDGPSSINIRSLFDPDHPTPGTGTNYQTVASTGSGALVNQKHDVMPADQAYSGASLTCANCHQPHKNNTANPVSNPDTGATLATYSPANSYSGDSPGFAYNAGGNSDPNDPEGCSPCGAPAELDSIEFCLTCHDAVQPAGVTLSANLENIADHYAGDQHGAGEGSTGTRFGKGTLKYPFTVGDGTTDPANPYAALNCTTCHGPHGTSNIFNLRESITVAGVQMSIGGLGPGSQFPKPTFDGPTYTLPVNAGSQNDHQWGAWCSFCHDQSAHAGVDETTSCNGAHKHGGNGF